MRQPLVLRSLALQNVRAYSALELELEPGPQLVWGPNAAGKTTLIEAIVVLATGRSHRTGTDAELIRWGTDFMRIEGLVVPAADRVEGEGTRLEVSLQQGGRKKAAVNGVPRRPPSLGESLRAVLFAPEEMLLVVGAPAARRAQLDGLAAPHDKTYASSLGTYGRALAQRNSLLRQIREEGADRSQLAYWNQPFLEAGSAVVASRLRLLETLAAPLAAAHREIAPDEEALTLDYATNAPAGPGESVRDTLARRLAETAEKEVWNGTTLVGPHRDDLVFRLGGRDMSTFASRGQQRTAILALKLAELDLLTRLDERPPLLLLDDVFSELDPLRRGHLVGRIAELPQTIVTTTAPEDLDPGLRRRARGWRVVADGAGARLEAVPR